MTSYGVDQNGSTIQLNLLAQIADINIEQAVIIKKILASNASHNFLALMHLTRLIY